MSAQLITLTLSPPCQLFLSQSPAEGEGRLKTVLSSSPLTDQHEDARLSRLRALLRAPEGLGLYRLTASY
jgi:hypothetical protein